MAFNRYSNNQYESSFKTDKTQPIRYNDYYKNNLNFNWEVSHKLKLTSSVCL